MGLSDEHRSAEVSGASDRNLRLCISIVHWNGGASTLACIESVLAQGYADLQIVLVDNGSADGIVEIVESRWPSIAIVRSPINSGFTGGHNLGIARAMSLSPDYVLLLNQDAVLLPACLDRMVSLADSDARIGLLSPMIYYADQPDRVQYRGSWFDMRRFAIVTDSDLEVSKARDRDPDTTMCLWGTALLIRRAVIETVGVLDARLFAYFEDTDYSARCAAAGFRNRMCFDAGILHEGHVDRSTRAPHFFYFMSRNQIVFWRTHGPRGGWLRGPRYCTARVLREAGMLAAARHDDQRDACVSGWWDGLVRHYGAYDRSRRAPRWLTGLLLAHPFFLANVLEGNWASLRPGRVRGSRA